MKCKDIRIKASDICKRNTGILVLITLIYVAITGAFSISFETGNEKATMLLSTLSVAGLFITGPMTYGILNVIILNHNGVKPAVKDLFEGFKYFWKLFVLNLLISIYTFLWALLFIILGIIKAVAYSKAYHIFYENPELSPKECIRQSMQLMDGHKWDNFCLMLSYIGWHILCVLTLGVLTLWVLPKVETADYIFYRLITKKEEQQQEQEQILIQEESLL